ncbi:MAG: hypothetical protein K1X53_06155 [Candidatus Sumerlaeaceae bacterium]|nr:hypothetical protein [Candidatus Sumerlaeaceae bacterium]
MSLRLVVLSFFWIANVSASIAQYVEADFLHGVHFPADQNANGGVAAAPVRTDVEDLFADSGVSPAIAGDGSGWILDFTATDVDDANSPFYQWTWQGGVFGATNKTANGYMAYSFRRATQGGKRHSPIVRVQPAYGRNVPYSTSFGAGGVSDPYTTANYASDVAAVHNLIKNDAKYFVIGNEVNIRLGIENNRVTTVSAPNSYQTQWDPTPEQYADCYMAVRDALAANATGAAGTPVALMQAPSPGIGDTNLAAGAVSWYDGVEFLWRQALRVNSVDPAKVGGFALHSYAEPGGPDSGNEGFFDAIREQLCVTGQLGQGGKPVFVTEFNKDMPDVANQNIGVSFVKRAYQTMNDWNTTTAAGIFTGLGNQKIRGTAWFLYPETGSSNVLDGFNRQSLAYWKTRTSPPAPDASNNIWYAFKSVAGLRYARGASGGGGTWPVAALWWGDDFNGTSLDTSPALPDWYAASSNGGAISQTGGALRFTGGASSQFGEGSVRTRGYVFGDFALDTKFVITDANRTTGAAAEANFDVRLREGSRGYSITFFTTPSSVNSGRIILRRTNVWSQIGSYNQVVSGGINSGDVFQIKAVADGANLSILIYKNGSASPVVNWTINDPPASGLTPNGGQSVGWVRMGTYGLKQVDVDYINMGGKQWNFVTTAGIEPEIWSLY